MKKKLLLFTFFKILISCNDKENISNKENIKDTIGSNNNSNSKIERKIIRDSIKFESYLHFSDFNVKVENVNAKIDLKSHELGKLFRTAIQKDYEDPELIFAGHYTLAFWGCGSPCQMAAMRAFLKKDYDYVTNRLAQANTDKQIQFGRIMRMRALMDYTSKEAYVKGIINNVKKIKSWYEPLWSSKSQDKINYFMSSNINDNDICIGLRIIFSQKSFCCLVVV